MTVVPDTERISERAKEIAARELDRLLERTPGSAGCSSAPSRRCRWASPRASSSATPTRSTCRAGRARRCGTSTAHEYRDFHNGFGVDGRRPRPSHDRRGHRARQPATASHFAVTVEMTVALAEELCRRFELRPGAVHQLGTEATMDAIRVARAATGRESIVKIEGGYHGHHDTCMFSVPSRRRRHRRARHAGRRHPDVDRHARSRHGRVGSASCRSTTPTRSSGSSRRRRRDRGADHGAGDDEHRHRAARSPAT